MIHLKTKLVCLAFVVGWVCCSGQSKHTNRVYGIVDPWIIHYVDTTEINYDFKNAMMGKSGRWYTGLFGQGGKFCMEPTLVKWVKDYNESMQDSMDMAVIFRDSHNCYLLLDDFTDYNSQPVDAVNEGNCI